MKLKVSYEKEESAVWTKIKLQSGEGDPKEEKTLAEEIRRKYFT